MARGSRRQDSPRRRNRDRHGRGLRGPLYPATLPAARSRAERFDALVIEALEPIEARWRTELTQLDVAVDDVPDVQVEGEDGVVEDGNVPLARLLPAGSIIVPESFCTAARWRHARRTAPTWQTWCTTSWSNRSRTTWAWTRT